MNADQSIAAVEGLIADLGPITAEFARTRDTNRGFDRLGRWKERAVRRIALEVSGREGERLSKQSPPMVLGDPSGNFKRLAAAYQGVLENLRDDLREHPEDVLAHPVAPQPVAGVATPPRAGPPDVAEVFVVHGHDKRHLREVELFLHRGNVEPVILHDQPNEGRTIIEKFEDHAHEVAFAVVIMTGDDMGGPGPQRVGQYKVVKSQPRRKRARQNVILELGFFMAQLGRGRVCVLFEDGVERPSDYDGVLYVPLAGDWKAKLAQELEAAKIPFNSVKALAAS